MFLFIFVSIIYHQPLPARLKLSKYSPRCPEEEQTYEESSIQIWNAFQSNVNTCVFVVFQKNNSSIYAERKIRAGASVID